MPKITIEFAESIGLIPEVDVYSRGKFLCFDTARIVSNDEYYFREKRRNKKYNIDSNGMVDFPLETINKAVERNR